MEGIRILKQNIHPCLQGVSLLDILVQGQHRGILGLGAGLLQGILAPAAEHPLDTPGLEAAHLDIPDQGAEHLLDILGQGAELLDTPVVLGIRTFYRVNSASQKQFHNYGTAEFLFLFQRLNSLKLIV